MRTATRRTIALETIRRKSGRLGELAEHWPTDWLQVAASVLARMRR